MLFSKKLFTPTIFIVTLISTSLLFTSCSSKLSNSAPNNNTSKDNTTPEISDNISTDPTTEAAEIPPSDDTSSLPSNSFFTPTAYDNGVIGINDQYGDRFYLVQGSKSALVIDTGVGMGNLKDYIDEICKLPYQVVLTHGHLDHAGGCYNFDDVYVSYDDIFLLEQDNACKAEKNSNNEPIIRDTIFHDLKDGQTFDLGDRTLEVITTPGHTPGSLTLIDRDNGMLFAGDTANAQTLLMFDYSTSVEEYRKSLLKLQDVENDYDTFYIAHPDYVIDKKCVNNLLDICDEILAGKNTPYPYNFQGESCFVAKKYVDGTCTREDGEIGNLVYNPDKIH